MADGVSKGNLPTELGEAVDFSIPRALFHDHMTY